MRDDDDSVRDLPQGVVAELVLLAELDDFFESSSSEPRSDHDDTNSDGRVHGSWRALVQQMTSGVAGRPDMKELAEQYRAAKVTGRPSCNHPY